MSNPKYYISEFYIKNLILSFFGLMAIGWLSLLLDHFPYKNMYLSRSLVLLTAISGLISIGYFNAVSAAKQHKVNPTYLHIFLVSLLCITDLIWGNSSIEITILRNLIYIIFLQVGIYLCHRKNRIKRRSA